MVYLKNGIKLLICFFVFSLFFQCNNTEAQNSLLNNIKKEDNMSLDTNIVIFELGSDNNWMSLFKNAKPAILNNQDLILIEVLLNRLTKDYTSNQDKNSLDGIKKIKDYKRQYVPFYKDKEKKVWVNCLCNEMKGWQNKIIQVKDGGNCYFNLIINLDKNIYEQVVINGF